jgi:hypothetical protein
MDTRTTHKNPWLFDVKIVGSNGCAYGSRWVMSNHSSVLYESFIEAQEIGPMVFNELLYTRDQLSFWLMIIHNHDTKRWCLEWNWDRKWDNASRCDGLYTGKYYVPTIMLCRKYKMTKIINTLLELYPLRDMSVYKQFTMNNAFDSLIHIYAHYMVSEIHYKDVEKLSKKIVKKLTLLYDEDIKSYNNNHADQYTSMAYWWRGMYVYRNECISDFYTITDIKIARDSVIRIGKNPICYRSAYDMDMMIGFQLWKNMSINTKLGSLKIVYDDWSEL